MSKACLDACNVVSGENVILLTLIGEGGNKILVV